MLYSNRKVVKKLYWKKASLNIIVRSHRGNRYTLELKFRWHIWHCMSAKLNTLWPSDAIWWHRSGSTLVQVIACCLTVTSPYQNQWWLVHSGALWTFIFHKEWSRYQSLIWFGNYKFKITATYSRYQWIAISTTTFLFTRHHQSANIRWRKLTLTPEISNRRHITCSKIANMIFSVAFG